MRERERRVFLSTVRLVLIMLTIIVTLIDVVLLLIVTDNEIKKQLNYRHDLPPAC